MKLKLHVLTLRVFLMGVRSAHAPKMKVQLLSSSAGEKTYAVIFGKGDEMLAGLTEFAV